MGKGLLSIVVIFMVSVFSFCGYSSGYSIKLAGEGSKADSIPIIKYNSPPIVPSRHIVDSHLSASVCGVGFLVSSINQMSGEPKIGYSIVFPVAVYMVNPAIWEASVIVKPRKSMGRMLYSEHAEHKISMARIKSRNIASPSSASRGFCPSQDSGAWVVADKAPKSLTC